MTQSNTNKSSTYNETTSNNAFKKAVDSVRSGKSITQQSIDLYEQLTEDERLWLLDGDMAFWKGMRSFIDDGYNILPYHMGTIDRLGIPGIRFVDGPRGCVVGNATAFPVSMARGATWDVALEERIGEAIGAEIRELGGNFFGGVCINLPRHPAWGRSQETYSDQPLLLGRMGAALSRGAQKHVMACMKHYALNSMENARFSVDVTVDEATLNEVYLPHFRYVAKSGVSAAMSSYNSINGEWAGQNSIMLTKILRNDWDFEGIVITDFIWGIRDGAKALNAGLDIEAPFHQQRGATLRRSLANGETSWEEVKRAGLRIISAQLKLYVGRQPDGKIGCVAGKEHIDLAREAARRGMVLLKNKNSSRSNQPLLPLKADKLKSLAVVGRLANLANTGDHGSSDVRAPYVVTALQGLSQALPDTQIVTADNVEDAVVQAKLAEIAVIIVGYTAEDEGEYVDGSVLTQPDLLRLYPTPCNEDEVMHQKAVMAAMYSSGASIVGGDTSGGDRRDLHLRSDDVEMIKAVTSVNPNSVVVVVSAGAVLMEEWIEQPTAVVLGWYSGMEGGHALADVLLGIHNPSGRLPYPIPASSSHLPLLDIDATKITYDRWYGQRLLQRNGISALFPLGYGLSYSTYTISDFSIVDIQLQNAVGIVKVSVQNNGDISGYEVVQIYGQRKNGSRANERELLGFSVVNLQANEKVTVNVELDLNALGEWNSISRSIVVSAGEIALEASSFWGDSESATLEIIL